MTPSDFSACLEKGRLLSKHRPLILKGVRTGHRVGQKFRMHCRMKRTGPGALEASQVTGPGREPVRGGLWGSINLLAPRPSSLGHIQEPEDSLQCCNNINNSSDSSDHQWPPCQVGFSQDDSGCPIRARSTQSWIRSLVVVARGVHYCAITTPQYEVLLSVVH